MTMTTADVLRCARDLIAREGGWTQGELARDSSGQAVSPTSVAACALCAEALQHVVLRRVHRWNDAPERTQAHVIAAFDRAIDAAECAP